MTTHCRGTRKGSTKPCKCLVYTKREKDRKCICHHSLELHTSTEPPISNSIKSSSTTVQDVVAKYRQYFEGPNRGTTQGANSNEAMARYETNKGFRVKKEGPSRSRTVSEKSQIMKMMKVGKVIFMPAGLDHDGTLINDKSPSPADIEACCNWSMLVSHKDSSLEYDGRWEITEVDTWMRSLFPKAFQWLDARWGVPEKGSLHWVLLQKSRQRLIILKRPKMTGEDLHDAQGVPSRGWRDHTIYITPQHPIPSEVLEDWDNAIANPLSFDELEEGDTSTVNDTEEAKCEEAKYPVKVDKGKGKAKSKVIVLSSDSDSEEPRTIAQQTRMTRSQTRMLNADDSSNDTLQRKRPSPTTVDELEKEEKRLSKIQRKSPSPIQTEQERWIETSNTQLPDWIDDSEELHEPAAGPSNTRNTSPTITGDHPNREATVTESLSNSPRKGFSRRPPRQNLWQ